MFGVLSPLAEGADRVVAEEVLDRSQDSILEVILPFRKSDYLKDFKTEDSISHFNNLIGKAKRVATLNQLPLTDQGYSEDKLISLKKHAYDTAGKVVVDKCDILIALWDSKKGRGKGGTAEIVKYAKDNQCPTYFINTTDPSNFKLISTDNFLKSIEINYKKIDEYNINLIKSHKHDSSSWIKPNLLPKSSDNSRVSLINSECIEAVEKLKPYYHVADKKAGIYQKYFRWGGLSIWLAFLAISIVSVGVIFFHTHPGFFGAELLIFFTIFIFWFINKKSEAHLNWMQYRYLAERIRCMSYLIFSMKKEDQSILDVEYLENRYVGKWVMKVCEELWHRLALTISSKTCDHNTTAISIAKYWIKHQIHFHRNAYIANSKRCEQLKRWGECLFWIAVAVAFIHVVVPFLGLHPHETLGLKLLTILTLCLPALAAAIEAHRSFREYKRNTIRSKKMLNSLERIESTFDLLAPVNIKSILIELGDLMIDDTQEWLSVVRFTELHKPV